MPKWVTYGVKYFLELGKIVCFHGNKKLRFYEIYCIWVTSFLVSKVETQGNTANVCIQETISSGRLVLVALATRLPW